MYLHVMSEAESLEDMNECLFFIAPVMSQVTAFQDIWSSAGPGTRLRVVRAQCPGVFTCASLRHTAPHLICGRQKPQCLIENKLFPVNFRY